MPKNIVVCCDGTSNDVTGHATNVLRLFRVLQRNDSQLTLYAPGVGTVSDPTAKTALGKWLSRRIDLGFGLSLRENTCEIYRFLAANYEKGDQIYLFGFSRGAYTVRAVAGMIQFLGLLRPEQLGMARHAWAIYSDDDSRLTIESRFESGRRFAKLFCLQPRPRIHFLGVWDTVSSFGWLWNLRTLPYTAKNPLIKHVRHAVAIDERRAMFQQNLLQRSSANDSFEEVWFAGGHGDVGGGWPEDRSGLSRITYSWIVEAAIECGLQIGRDPMANFFRSDDSSEARDGDACAPINDALTGWWWLVEAVPRRLWDPRKRRMRWSRPHFAKRRKIPFGAAIHCCVGEKMLNDPRYRPPGIADD